MMNAFTLLLLALLSVAPVASARNATTPPPSKQARARSTPNDWQTLRQAQWKAEEAFFQKQKTARDTYETSLSGKSKQEKHELMGKFIHKQRDEEHAFRKAQQDERAAYIVKQRKNRQQAQRKPTGIDTHGKP